MKIQEFSLSERKGKTIKVLIPIPKKGDPWGDFAPLVGTFWEHQIPLIPGDTFSTARHGYLIPLWRCLGPEPKHLLQQVPKEFQPCFDRKDCRIAGPHCFPNPKMPMCYRPLEKDAQVRDILARVFAAWKEGRYVLVINGPEFVV